MRLIPHGLICDVFDLGFQGVVVPVPTCPVIRLTRQVELRPLSVIPKKQISTNDKALNLSKISNQRVGIREELIANSHLGSSFSLVDAAAFSFSNSFTRSLT